MTRLHSLWEKLKASGSFTKDLLLDEVISKLEIETPIGLGFLECQLRENRASGERYVVLKSKGGEATVFVPLDDIAAKQLIEFLSQLGPRPSAQ